MYNKLRRPEGRHHQTAGLQDPAWGLLALWTGIASVAGAASVQAAPMAAFGPGVAVLAGAGIASVSAVALAAGLRKRAAKHAVCLPAAPPFAPPQPVSGADPILAELFGGLAAQVANLEERMGDSGVRPGSSTPAATDAAMEALARSVERLEREQRATQGGLDAASAEADRRAELRLEALASAMRSRLDAVGDELASLRRDLEDAETRSRDSERRIFDILRARDARKALRQLDVEAADLFDKLFYCEERTYGSRDAWRADYAEWRSRIKAFWDIVRGYVASVDQPFAVCDADIERAGGVPETALFATHDMRVRFKMLVVVNERHLKFREDAFQFNARKGSPPELAVPPALWPTAENQAPTEH